MANPNHTANRQAAVPKPYITIVKGLGLDNIRVPAKYKAQTGTKLKVVSTSGVPACGVIVGAD